MSITESECIESLNGIYPEWCSEKEEYEMAQVAIQALSEIQQYRAIGTVEEFRENKNFLEFLHNHILPNEMEQYLTMYHASEEKSVYWSEGKE